LCGDGYLCALGLGLISEDILPFPTYYPAVLFAALLGGPHVGVLATDAAKYGALAGPTGRLDIVWSVTAGEMVIRWRESGALAVSLSGHQGFGTRLLPRALAPFGGNIERRFEPDGLICKMSLKVGTAQDLGRPVKPTLPITEDNVVRE